MHRRARLHKILTAIEKSEKKLKKCKQSFTKGMLKLHIANMRDFYKIMKTRSK